MPDLCVRRWDGFLFSQALTECVTGVKKVLDGGNSVKICYMDAHRMDVRSNVNFKITDIIKKDGELTIVSEKDIGEKVVIVISKEELIRIYASAL